MSIKTKDWIAQINRMPGDPFFRTFCTVTVANSGVTPRLVMSATQDKTTNLRLELLLEKSDGMSLQVLTEKFVQYKEQGDSNVTGVSIFYNGEKIHHIKDIMITH
ncbi:hypothetical protein [Pseudomonas sp. LB3P31]